MPCRNQGHLKYVCRAVPLSFSSCGEVTFMLGTAPLHIIPQSAEKKKTQTGCNHTRRHYSADHRHGWMIDGWMCRGRKGGSGKRAAVSRQTRVYPLEKKKPPFLFFPILFYPVFCQLAQCHSLFCLDAPVPLYDKGRAERRW